VDWTWWKDAVGSVLLPTLAGIALMYAMWPNDRRGRKLLVRWGIASPGEHEIQESVRYLRWRWLSYPWLFVLLLVGSRAMGRPYDEGGLAFIGTFLAGGFAADLIALRASPARSREAAPQRRGLFTLVPGWAVGLYLGVVALTVAVALIDLTAAAWIPQALAGVSGAESRIGSPLWTVFTVSGLCALMAGAVIFLAMVRPASGDHLLDAVLRTRSSRVALGIAIGIQGLLLGEASWRLRLVGTFDEKVQLPGWLMTAHDMIEPLGFVVALVCLVGWNLVAGPRPLRLEPKVTA
jgi:hypothetical protein